MHKLQGAKFILMVVVVVVAVVAVVAVVDVVDVVNVDAGVTGTGGIIEGRTNL